MKATFNLNAPVLNLGGYKKALERHMSEVIVRAASQWLEAVIMEIPLWSGASRATFLKLARAVGDNLNVAGKTMDRVSRGMTESTGYITTQIDRGVFTFTYGTTLPWLIWNEYHNANTDPDPTKWPKPAELTQPGPYGFQEIGMRVFQKFADSVKLPAVAPFIVSHPVRK